MAARAVCDSCGKFTYLDQLFMQTREGARTNLMVCERCLDVDFKTKVTPRDEEMVKNPRPDTTVRYLAASGEFLPKLQLHMRYGKIWGTT